MMLYTFVLQKTKYIFNTCQQEHAAIQRERSKLLASVEVWQEGTRLWLIEEAFNMNYAQKD